MPGKQRVSAAELVRNFGYWQEKALLAPVYITHHKRDRLVLTSIDSLAPLKEAPTVQPHPRPGEPPSAIISEYAILLENISDAYVVLDAQLTIVAVNARFETLMRVNRGQLIGRNIQEFLPESKPGLFIEKIRRVLVSGQADQIELATPAFPGLHLSTRIYPDPRGVALLHTNISELKALRGEIAVAESLKAAIDRHPQTAHVQTDSRGKITYSDETTQLWTGFDSPTLLNTRITDIVLQTDRRRMTEAFDDVLSSHLPTALTVRVLGKDFTEYEVMAALAPIMAEHNAIGVTLIATLVGSTPLGEAS